MGYTLSKQTADRLLDLIRSRFDGNGATGAAMGGSNGAPQVQFIKCGTLFDPITFNATIQIYNPLTRSFEDGWACYLASADNLGLEEDVRYLAIMGGMYFDLPLFITPNIEGELLVTANVLLGGAAMVQFTSGSGTGGGIKGGGSGTISDPACSGTLMKFVEDIVNGNPVYGFLCFPSCVTKL